MARLLRACLCASHNVGQPVSLARCCKTREGRAAAARSSLHNFITENSLASVVGHRSQSALVPSRYARRGLRRERSSSRASPCCVDAHRPVFFFCDAYGLSDVNEETARELSAVTSRRQPSPSVRESASAQGRRDATVSPLGAFQLTTSAVVPTTSCQGDVRSAR